MIIDIKISDNNGKQLHHYKQKIDDNTDFTFPIPIISDTRKTFHQFLSQYLSESGRVIRDKLIPEEYMHSRIQSITYMNYSNPYNGTKFLSTDMTSEDNQLTCNIRLTNLANYATQRYEANFYIEEDNISTL